MIYFLKHKSDMVEATKQFLADTAPLGKVKCIRGDNGEEFVGHEFKVARYSFLKFLNAHLKQAY